MINLGVIGLSEGNGHPYSWAAIMNGYNSEAMKNCPFPVIPEYLRKQSYPEDFINDARVTHIWTQEQSISQQVAKASNITSIISKPEDMIGHVDGILLARDDYQNHMKFANPFLESGLPIYIDKPLANSVADAQELLDLQHYPEQIFTCSALRYLPELGALKKRAKDISSIHAHTPKSWSLYGIHIIEPIAALLKMNDRYNVTSNDKMIEGEKCKISLTYKNVNVVLESSGTAKGNIFYAVTFKDGTTEHIIVSDVFIAFRSSLEAFLSQMQNKSLSITREETLTCMHILELGNH